MAPAPCLLNPVFIVHGVVVVQGNSELLLLSARTKVHNLYSQSIWSIHCIICSVIKNRMASEIVSVGVIVGVKRLNMAITDAL